MLYVKKLLGQFILFILNINVFIEFIIDKETRYMLFKS